MKRVLAVVACGSLRLAPCQASSGWGAAGSAAGAGGSWPSPPPSGPPQGPPADEQSNSQPPLDPANYYHPNAPPAAGGEGFEAAAAGNDGTAAGYHEPHAYRHDPQQQHYQQQQQQQQPPPYDPSFIPQQSRWAGQHRQQQQQQQQQQQRHFPQHEGYPPASGGGGNSGGPGQPLHLGTKWRNMVSRVKDAVRPGQPPSPDYGGYQAGYGGWAEGGGGGYSPPGSSWVGAANHNERYNPPQGVHSGQAQPSANSGYGAHYGQQQQQQLYGGDDAQPAAAAATADYGGYPPGGSDGAAARFDHQGQQQHHAAPPQTYFDGADASAQPPGPPPEETQAQSQAPPDLYTESNVDGSSSSSSSSGHRCKTENTEGYGGGSGGGDQHAGMVGATTMSEGQRVAVGGGLPAREPSFESQQPAAPSAVGQGWSTPDTVSAPIATSHQAPAAASRGSGHGNGAAMATVPNGSAWTPPGGQGGGVQDDGPNASGPPAGVAAVGTPSESRVEPHESAAAKGEFGGSGSLRANQGTSSLDTMPTSADHGMEKVDWGKGAEEAEGEGGTGAGEGESGETVVVPGSEERLELEREEEALIRELGRMDSSIENGDSLLGAGGAGVGVGASSISSSSSSSSSSLPSSSPAPAPLEDQAMIDEAVEHQLDDIFDSIILDEEIDVDVDFEVDVDADSADAAAAAAAEAAEEGGGFTSVAHERPAESVAGGDLGLFDEGTADVAREEQPTEPWQGTQTAPADLARTPGGPKPRAHEGDAPPEGAPAAGSPWGAAATAGAEKAPAPTPMLPLSAAAEAAAAAAAATAPEAEAEAGGGGSGSLWGSTDRWDSLPPQPEPDISDSEEEEQEEEQEEERGAELVQRVEEDVQESDGVKDDEDEADVRVPLDPIELPPSAATDEIWNDQHLQDQLDAYWEQSRRGGAAAAGVGAAPPPTGVQQLSAYGSGEPHLQPTYGPGDWVGGGAGGALLPEPLPGAVAPRLFQGGNQAPINIYGNVHVHLQQGGADQQQQQQQQQGGGREGRPSAELSARERYYSQGETSWSGSERGGQ